MNGVKLPKMKWFIVVVTLAVSLPMLFGGYWLWQRHAINQPLIDQLRQVPGVNAVQLDKDRSGLRIDLVAEQSIDFVQTAPVVQALVDEVAKGAEITWGNNSDAALAETRKTLDFILREAQIRHEYVTMLERVRTKLGPTDVVFQLGVDERFIYLKLQLDEQVWLETLPVINQGGLAQ